VHLSPKTLAITALKNRSEKKKKITVLISLKNILVYLEDFLFLHIMPIFWQDVSSWDCINVVNVLLVHDMAQNYLKLC